VTAAPLILIWPTATRPQTREWHRCTTQLCDTHGLRWVAYATCKSPQRPAHQPCSTRSPQPTVTRPRTRRPVLDNRRSRHASNDAPSWRSDHRDRTRPSCPEDDRLLRRPRIIDRVRPRGGNLLGSRSLNGRFNGGDELSEMPDVPLQRSTACERVRRGSRALTPWAAIIGAAHGL